MTKENIDYSACLYGCQQLGSCIVLNELSRGGMTEKERALHLYSGIQGGCIAEQQELLYSDEQSLLQDVREGKYGTLIG